MPRDLTLRSMRSVTAEMRNMTRGAAGRRIRCERTLKGRSHNTLCVATLCVAAREIATPYISIVAFTHTLR